MDCIASELRNDVLERADVCPSLLLDFTLQVTSLDSTCASCSFNSHAWTRCIWTERLGRSPSRHESIVTSNMESNSLQSVGCVGQVNLAYRYIQSNFRWSFVYFVKYCLNPSKKSNALHKPGQSLRLDTLLSPFIHGSSNGQVICDSYGYPLNTWNRFYSGSPLIDCPVDCRQPTI